MAKIARVLVWLALCVGVAGAPMAIAQLPTGAAPGAAAADGEAPQPNILIVASYDKSAMSTLSQENAIRAALAERVPRARVRSEYLSAVRKESDGPGPELLASMTQSLRLKIGSERFDLVMTIDSLAFEALSGPGRDLVDDRPVVFSGLTWDAKSVAAAHLNATGILERVDGAGTVELIQQLLPRTRTVLALCHGMAMADSNRREVEEQLMGLSGGPEVRWSGAATLDEVKREAEGLGPDSAILYIAFREVKGDVPGPEAHSVKWPVPAFGVYESNLRPSLVGGRMVSAGEEGREAGEIAARVVGGASPREIPIRENKSLVVMNGPLMKRWGIAASMLPAGAVVRDPVAPWYAPLRENWRWAILVCALQLAVIAMLLANLVWRRRAERELRLSRERYELAIQGTDDGIWDWDINSDRTYRSPRYEQLLGYEPGELFDGDWSWSERLHPDDRERVGSRLTAHLERGEAYDEEYRLRMKDGTYRWFRSLGKAIRDGGGRPVRMAGSLREIHDRKEAAERLRESEERYRQTFNTNQAVKLVIDVETQQLVDVNEAACGFYGYTRERLLTMGIFDINMAPREELAGRIDQAERGSTHFEANHRLASGEVRNVEVYTGPFRMRGRRVLYSIIHDVTERNRARQAQAESEARYRRIVETAREGIWVVDTEWRTTFINAMMGQMLGYTPAEMMGRHLLDFMDDQAREECTRNMGRREEGIAEQHDFRFQRKDGSALWVMMSTNAITGEDGRFAGALAMVTDMTERRSAEEGAREAEKRFRTTFEHAAVGMSNVTLDGRWLMANDRLCEMLGRDRQTLMGINFAEVTHPDDLQENLRLLRRAIAGGGDRYALEKRYLRPDGTIVWAHVTASLVRDAQGRPEHLISVVQDISDRKRTEAALEDSRRLLEQAQEVGRIGGWTSDGTQGGMVEWSAEVSRIFGLNPGTFDGRADTFREMVHPEDRIRVAEEIRAAIAGERAYDFDHRIVRPDGAVRWVHEQAQIQRDDKGRVVRMIGVTQDITERAEAERFDAEQRRVLELMAAGAPLERTIEAIVRMIEGHAGPPHGAIGSVLRLDELRRMRTVSAPGLPAAYCEAIEGVEIGPCVGCCGTAMYSKRRVVVEDIETDPLWAEYKELALRHGLRACWSEPIIGTDGSVLGSFAMYFKEKHGPSERDLAVISTAAHLAGIAMERARIEESRNRSEATNRALLAANPDLMFRLDREGRYLGYHAPDPRRLLVPPERFLGRVMEDVLPPDRAAECRENMEKMFTTGESQMYEYGVVRSDGSSGLWEVRVVQGMAGEALLLLRDVTEQKAAERRVRESEERLRLLVENTPLGVVYFDTEFRVTGWNPGAQRLFGHTEQEALGRHASFLVPDSARRSVGEVWRGLMLGKGGERSMNQNVRKDGALVFCEWYNSSLVDQSGRVIGVASVVEDVTERRRVQQRQDFMMAELDHRVKNNLAAVISLAEQTGRGAGTYREFLDKFMGRIRAMSRMHSVLARSRWQGADLRTLVTQTLEAFGSDSAGRATVDGESVMLGARAAQAMAMALNELATNAVKYGALSAPGGVVHVTWTSEGEGVSRILRLRWEESGGPTVARPEKRGFGSQLIEGAIAYELRGTVGVEFEPGGVVCTMVVPVGLETDEQPRLDPGFRDMDQP